MPEFSVDTEQDDTLSICFHNDFYPSIRFDNSFKRLATTLSGSEKTYAQDMIGSANKLIHAVEMRQQVMDKLARIIVREQSNFFLGRYGLLPLRVDDTAAEIGVHETTVYRALQGKYLYCARGTFPLSHFFSRELSDGVSTAHVKEMVR